MTHTAEEVRANVAENRRHMTTATEAQLTAYADLLERRSASVTDEAVTHATEVASAWLSERLIPNQVTFPDQLRMMRTALEAVWPVAAEPARPADSGRAMDALRDLVEACEAEFCGGQTDAEPDNSKVAYPEDECHITFGHIRRARAALAAQGQPAEPTQDEAVAICNLCHELWSMAQGPDPISQAVARMEIRLATWMATYQAQPRAVPAERVSDVQTMVNNFLHWRLPDDFAPDAGISFNPGPTQHLPHCWPVGTNLFTAAQAEQMFRYVLAAAPQPGEPNTAAQENGRDG